MLDFEIAMYRKAHSEAGAPMEEEQDFMDNNELLQAILSEIKTIKTDISDLKEDVSNLKAGQTAMQEDIAGLKNDVSGLKDDVSDLRAGQATMQEDIDEIKHNTEVTRDACNTMGEWIEEASRCFNIPYPNNKAI